GYTAGPCNSLKREMTSSNISVELAMIKNPYCWWTSAMEYSEFMPRSEPVISVLAPPLHVHGYRRVPAVRETRRDTEPNCVLITSCQTTTPAATSVNEVPIPMPLTVSPLFHSWVADTT